MSLLNCLQGQTGRMIACVAFGFGALAPAEVIQLPTPWEPAPGGFVDDPTGFGLYGLATIGNRLFFGGQFATAGGQAAGSIAAWNGSSWETFAGGFDGTAIGFVSVGPIVQFNGELYAGGFITSDAATLSTVRGLARFDAATQRWVEVGGGIIDTAFDSTFVSALEVFNGELIVGGLFTQAGGVPVGGYIAAWNGTSWRALDGISDTTNPFFEIYDFEVYNNELYVGGIFNLAGGQPASGIAKWDGSTWGPIPGGQLTVDPFGDRRFGNVRTLGVYNGELIAGGIFDDAGGAFANNIAAWNGSGWRGLGLGVYSGSGFGEIVSDVEVFNGELVAAGRYEFAGTVAANNLASWDGAEWKASFGATPTIPSGLTYRVAVFQNDLYVIGDGGLGVAVYGIDAPCPADLTGDGTANIFDIFEFFNRFAAGDLSVDFVTGGGLNIFDIFEFFALFAAGC